MHYIKVVLLIISSNLTLTSFQRAANDQIRENLKPITMWQSAMTWKSIQDVFEVGRPKFWLPIPVTHLNQTCVVTAVRDPIEHFLSGYNEFEYRVGNRPQQFSRYENGTTARFEQFVTDFVGGAASSGIPVTDIGLYHMFSMTGVLWELKRQRNRLGEDAPRLTAYLPSLSNLDVEFPKFLMRSCNGLPPEMGIPFSVKTRHSSEDDVRGFYSAAKRAWSKQDTISRALCAIHAMDYACFDSIPIPSLCESVFFNQNFHEIQAAEAT